MANTKVPKITFTPRGFQAPTETAIRNGVLQDWKNALGPNLNPAANTPQGQIITSEAATIKNTDDDFVYISNQMDPAFSEGRFQDGIGRIYFISRTPAEPTVVDGVCTGLVDVPIPAGAQVQDQSGNRYTAVDGGVIGADGTVTLQFACNVVGPITCAIGTLTKIYRAIPGWDTVNNPSEGVIGQNAEGRAEFEARRAASVALNSRGALPAVEGAVLAVPKVLDAYVTENVDDAPLVIGTVTLAPHSLYVCASGGSSAAIAQAIWTKKSPGCNYNGSTTVTVEDTSEGYSPPYPSYDVKFQRPTALPILFRVVVFNSPQVPADAATQIQAAIIATFAGADGGGRARIGTELFASRYYGPVAMLGSWAILQSLTVASYVDPDAEFTASIASSNLMTVSAVGSGALAVGQMVSGAGGGDGVYIASLGSGTGGAGTYHLNAAGLTVGSEAMVSVAVDETSVDVEINQVPTITSANIIVVLT